MAGGAQMSGLAALLGDGRPAPVLYRHRYYFSRSNDWTSETLDFVPDVYVVACRHRQRVQRADETITQYIAASRALAAPCAFGQMEGEMLRDQLIANVSLTAVKDKLLLEKDLTLEKVITIACQAAVKKSSLLRHYTAMKSVQAISMDTKYGRRGKGARSTKQSHSAQSRSEDRKLTATGQQRRQCFRCGSDKHLANDKSCPAAKVTCRLCGKKVPLLECVKLQVK